MRTVFMGTPDFADASLKALLGSRHEVCAVFTRADTPKNRGMKMTMPPVKITALAEDIPVYQPSTLRSQEVYDILASIQPDIIIVAAYGMFLPKSILELPRYGCINVHASLLPKYRGASPINAAIIEGESQTGVTIMKMAKGIDTGDMLISRAVDILPDDSYASLHDKLAPVGGQLLLEALDLIESGNAIYTPQDDSLSTYAHIIKTEDARISFEWDAAACACHIRGYDPAPGAFAFLGGERIKLFSAVKGDAAVSRGPGEIIGCDKKGLAVQAKDGVVLIREVQLNGKKRMPAADCFRGRPQLLEERFD